MSEPEVTVNVVASLAKLEEGLKAVPQMIDRAAAASSGTTPSIPLATPKVKITDNAGKKGSALAGFNVPNKRNEEDQLAALRQLNDRLVKEWVDLDNAGEGTSDAAKKLEAALDELAILLEASKNNIKIKAEKAAKPTEVFGDSPSSGKSGAGPETAEIPAFEDPEEQLSALREFSDRMDALLQKMVKAGQGGSVAADLVRSKLNFAIDESLKLEEQLEQIAAKGQKAEKAVRPPKEKAPKPVKPPPLPKPEDKFGETLGKMKDISQAMSQLEGLMSKLGISGGRSLGGLSSRFATLSGTLARIGPALGAIAVAAVAVIAVLAVVAAGIAVAISLTKQAIAVASEYEQKLVKLSGSLGNLANAKVSLETVTLVTKGTGVDKNSLLALIPKLEAETRGALNSKGGLQLITDVAARVDPSKVGEIGSAISGAYATLRQGGDVTSFNNHLVEMGVISGETARKLELMQRSGATQQQLWAALAKGMRDTGDGAKNANQTLGGLMERLKTSVSNAWEGMMAKMGEQAVATLGPAFEKLVLVLEAILPKLASGVSFAAGMLAQVTEWIASIVEGVAYGITAIQGLAKQGKLGELFTAMLTLGFLKAANALVNALAIGVQMVVDMLLMPFKAITDGRMWSALGNTLSALVKLFIAQMGGITGVLLTAAAAMIKYVIAGLQYAKDMFTPGKDANWDKALEEAGRNSVVTSIGDAGATSLEIAGAAASSGLKDAASALGDVFSFGMENGPLAKLVRGEYDSPDILKDSIDKNQSALADLLKVGFDAMPNPFKKEEKSKEELAKETPGLKDVTGQGGPKAVVDSLQSVGGGGFSFGISWQDRMLEETKTQNLTLNDIAANTANTNGVYGGAPQGESPIVILSTISANVAAILAALTSGGGGSKGVTVRS